MAALVRMSKLVTSNTLRTAFRVGLARNSTLACRNILGITARKENIEIPKFLHRHLATESVFESLTHEAAQNEQAAQEGARDEGRFRRGQGSRRDDNTLDTRVETLDLQMKRTGRLDVGQLYAVLSMARKNAGLTEQQALVLIRGCGQVLSKETVANRQKIFNEIWERIPTLVPKLDISHHNAALRTRLENKEKIEPAEVLSHIEGNLNLFPNRITYQLLISAYCENGDLAGATNILEHMKSQEIPINEAVFNALIQGHMAQGDVEGAKGILESMKSSGLLPLAETYKTLMCGFAAQGNLEQIKQTLSEAEREEVSFQSRNFFEVLVALVDNGHKTSFSQFKAETAERFSGRRPYNHEAMNCAFRLVTLGHDTEAMEVLQTVSLDSIPDQAYVASIGRQMLEAYVSSNRNIDQIQAAVEELKKSGFLTESPLADVASMAVKMRNIDIGFDVFKLMQSQGEEVQRINLHPLLILSRQSQDTDIILNNAVKAADIISRDKNICFNLAGEVVRPLVKRGMSAEEVFSKLAEKGMPESTINDLRVLECLENGRFAEAKQLVTSNGAPGLAVVSVFLSRGYDVSRDLNGLLEFVTSLRSFVVSEPYYKDITTSTLSRIISLSSTDAGQAQSLIKAFMERELILFKGSSQDDILKRLRTKSLEDDQILEIEESFNNLSIPDKSSQDFNEEQMKNLEMMLETNPETVPQQLRNRGEMKLLRQYCWDGNTEKADALIASMEARGFRFPVDLQNTLGIYYAHVKQDLDTALAYKDRVIKAEKPVRTRLSLAIACGYAAQDNVEKAIEEITSLSPPTITFRYQLIDSAEKLVRLCARTTDAATVRELVQTMFDKGLVQDGAYSLLVQVLKTYLNKGEPDEVVSTLKDYVTKYGKVFHFNRILEYFIKKEDADRLQAVVDLGAVVQGEMEVLHHLIFSFVDCDKVRQAKKIVETPGLRANMSILNKGMEQYFLRNMVDEMKQVKDLTQGMPGISRDDMLFWLIKLYTRRKEPRLALDVLTCYEEEGVPPRHRTLRYLANVLRNNEMDVPFEVPKIPEKSAQDMSPKTPVTTTSENLTTEQEILRRLGAGQIQDAIDLRQSALNGGENLRADILASGVQELKKSKQIEVTRDLITALGNHGDVDSLLHIRPKVSYGLNSFLHKALFRAYLKSGREEEILTHVSQDLSMLRKYINVANIELLDAMRPDLFPKFVDIIKRYQENVSNASPINNLYSYYLLTDKTDAAHELLEQYPDIRSTISVRGILYEISEREKENLFPVLANLVHESARDNFVYTKWLEYKCNKNDVDGATKVFEEARSRGIELDKIYVYALEKYQTLLESSGKSVPWEPETLQKIKNDLEEKRRSNQQQSQQSEAVTSE